ncbi:hypothetical protein TEA_012260 [Camellia sinensis var. sinensis]|uniref:UBC core domain-containing protein n=1 Tax=Camellia sinensis var. sinensis TaxID=542762 RepID=A0A4S4DHM8_CAMSN|nr:hypothetical protein TEA_012260 [Camellia sinensis var. sinensis]
METETMQSCARKILERELRDINENPSTHISFGPLSDDNMFQWQGIIIGPWIPLWKVCHPNIGVDGTIQINILGDQWSSALTTEKLLLSIFSILLDPILEDSLCPMSNPYRHNMNCYNKKARGLTKKPEDLRSPRPGSAQDSANKDAGFKLGVEAHSFFRALARPEEAVSTENFPLLGPRNGPVLKMEYFSRRLVNFIKNSQKLFLRTATAQRARNPLLRCTTSDSKENCPLLEGNCMATESCPLFERHRRRFERQRKVAPSLDSTAAHCSQPSEIFALFSETGGFKVS